MRRKKSGWKADSILSRRKVLAGMTSAVSLASLSGCLGGGDGDGPIGGMSSKEEEFFNRVEVDDEGKVRIGYNHDELGSDQEEVSKIVVLDEDGEEIDSSHYYEDDQSVELRLAESSLMGTPLFTFGEFTIQAQNDFGDVFEETTLEYAPDVSVTGVSSLGAAYEPRDRAANYDSRDGNSWGEFEVTLSFENAGNAPAPVDDIELQGVDEMFGVRPAVHKYGEMEWENGDVAGVPSEGSDTVTFVIDHTESSAEGERVYKCGESHSATLLVTFDGDLDPLEVPVSLELSGGTHSQTTGIFTDTFYYCEEFDISLE